MPTIYKETEYQFVELENKKIVLSILDELDMSKILNSSGDLSTIEIVIYAQNVVFSDKLKAKSIKVYANSISTPKQMDNVDEFKEYNTYLIPLNEKFSLADMRYLELYDYQSQIYTSISNKIFDEQNIIVEEKIAYGSKNIDIDSFMFANPEQCSMLLEKGKLLYRMGDPESNEKDLDQAIEIFEYLRKFLEPFVDLKDDTPLAKLYKENESSIATFDSINSFKNIYHTADGFLGQIKNGSDFYGNSYNYVPLASKEFYETMLDKQIENFNYIEENYFTFIDAKTKEDERLSNLKSAMGYLGQLRNEANSEINSLKARLISTESEINTLESQFEEKRDLVEQRLEELKDNIEQSFNFSIKSLISSIKTLISLKKASPFKFISTGGKIGFDIYKSATTVENDDGVSIKKDYLVNEIKTFEGDISSESLAEQSHKLDDGSIKLDDPGANKLLVEEQKLDKFLSDFYDKFPTSTKALKDAFEDYVNLVLERNQKVLYYNSLVTLIVKNHNIIKESDQKRSILNEENLKKLQPSLPMFTIVMGNLYTSSQAQVMETLYLTQRALLFWSLNNDKPVTDIFSNNQLTSINTSILKAAQSAIFDSLEKVIENYKKIPPQHFSIENRVDGSISWYLSEDQINSLKKEEDGEYTVLFQIPYDTKETAKEDNPFAGYADIRLTQVYVWIDGVKSADNEVNLTITHTGAETIINKSNQKFEFIHNSKNVPFKYNLESKDILEGGNIGNGQYDNTYALVGPFTWWNLTLKSKYNKDLDISNISKVQIQFQGTNYPFDN